MNDIKLMNRAADNIRILAASMVEKAKSGHPGGAMGGADFVNVLFSEFLVYDPKNPKWEGRDRFFLDPGHMSPMLYSVLALTGKFSMDELKNFRQWGTVTPGHPEVNVERGIENTSGPLGQGHTYAVGAAIAAKFLQARLGKEVMDQTIYAYISDGGIQEEISQGAGRVAGTLGLDNLIMFYDANNVQLSTKVDEVDNENVALKYEAWGWKVISINGNDADAIRQALKDAKAEKEKPTLIIGTTVMGKGALGADHSSYENKVSTHGQPLSAAGVSIEETIKNLGGDPENPFVIFPEVAALYAKREAELNALMEEKKAVKKAWAEAHPDLAVKMDNWFAGRIPEIDWAGIQQKANQATRVASATVLGVLASSVENMICASADLSNSDKTDGFLKKTHAFVKGDFSGAFFQAGVAELTMACICIGMSLHGGVIAACGTFFVFSDYMKPALRMAALMEQPVKFVWSHDAFRVGEDGPTHEPVEQLAAFRSLPNFCVYRPCDRTETAAAWYRAVTSKDQPTALVLTRQNLSQMQGSSKEALKGGYILEDSKKEVPDAIIIASGSEVELAVNAKAELAKDGVDVRVVSMPSMEAFEEQTAEYKESVLPKACRKRVAVEALSDFGWYRYVGLDGKVVSMTGFGASGPAASLFEKFGFTTENVVAAVKSVL